jgi:hypothetical protein
MSKKKFKLVEEIERRKPKTPIYGKTERRKVKHFMNSLNANYAIDEDYDDPDYDDEDEYEDDDYEEEDEYEDEEYEDDEDY